MTIWCVSYYPIYRTLHMPPKTFSTGWIVNLFGSWVRNNFSGLLNTYGFVVGFKDGFQLFSYSLFILQTWISLYFKDPIFLEKLQVFARTLLFWWFQSFFIEKVWWIHHRIINTCKLEYMFILKTHIFLLYCKLVQKILHRSLCISVSLSFLGESKV